MDWSRINLFARQGWQCPICGRVYSPYNSICLYCNKGATADSTPKSEQPESTRTFVELVVKYPDPELCTYKEYKGKPYYSIKYIENGETHVGYGTYNPEVLSQYLKEYFILSTQPETAKRIVGESRGGTTMWYQCDMCNEPVDEKDTFCSGCGRRLVNG